MNVRVKKNFDTASHTYSQWDEVQKQAAHHLVHCILQACPTLNPYRILDVGCGTGNLTESLLTSFPRAIYHANDLAPSMLQHTQHRFSSRTHITLYPGDIETITLPHTYHVIGSNMCMQWVKDLPHVVKTLLRRTGILAFSCVLHDTFRAWYDLLESQGIFHATRSYPTLEDMRQSLSKVSAVLLSVSEKTWEVSFPTVRQGMRYLKDLGAQTPNKPASSFVDLYKFLKHHDTSCHFRYNIGFFILRSI